ncbi:MAG TPA: hypothetical protein VM533_06315 [Fimbriiglobus sp.]|jgi:hypothetical protein|nr:hypothetical protein [Fimbriiglobus sp.]
MKQTLLALLFAAAPVLAVGCGKSDSEKQPVLTGTPDPKVTGPAMPGTSGKVKPVVQPPAAE